MVEAVIVDADGNLRRGGPFTIERQGAIGNIPRGETMVLPIRVESARDSDRCLLTWSIAQGDGTQLRDGVAECSFPSLTLPDDTPVGAYRLTVNVYDGRGPDPQFSDGISTAVTVTDVDANRSR